MKKFSSLSTPLSAAFDYFSWTPFVLLKDTAIHFSKIVGLRYLVTHVGFQIGTQMALNYFNFYLSEKIAMDGDNLDVAYNKLPDAENSEVWDAFMKQLYNFLPIIPYQIGQSIIDNSITYYADRRLRHALEDKINTMYFGNQLGLSLSHLPEDQEIVNNMYGDIAHINASGSYLITSFISSVQNAIFSMPVLWKYSSPWKIGPVPIPDLLAASLLYALATQKISAYITHQQKKIDDALVKAGTRFSSIVHHDQANIKNITIAHAEEFTKERHASLTREMRSLSNERKLYSIALSVWSIAHSFCNRVFKYYVLGWKLFSKIVPYEKRSLVAMSDDNVQYLFSWTEMNNSLLTQLAAPLDRIKKLLQKEEENRLHPSKLVFKKSEKAAIDIKDLTIKKNDTLIVAIPSLVFEKGKRYLLSGASGNGKSTLLAKIMNIIPDGFDAEGSISLSTYGRKGKLIMIPQIDFMPNYSSLLEILAMPNALPKDPIERQAFKDQAYRLISMAKMNSDNSAMKKNETILSLFEEERNEISWSNILSGGQKKKIALISALLAEPDILLLDEIFAGLDTGSIEIVKNMLKEYLPNATLLIVDHPRSKNLDNFYDSHLLFEKQSVEWVKKPTPSENITKIKPFVERVKNIETPKRSMSF